MPIATVKQLCTPNPVVNSDSLVEQVAQIEDFASGRVDERAFFQRNYFTAGLELLVRRGFERLAAKSEDGAFYLTQAMGGGKTHSLIAFGLLAADPALRREVVPKLAGGADFGAAKVVIFNGHQNPDTLLWGYLAEKLGRGDVNFPVRASFSPGTISTQCSCGRCSMRCIRNMDAIVNFGNELVWLGDDHRARLQAFVRLAANHSHRPASVSTGEPSRAVKYQGCLPSGVSCHS